MFVHDAVDGCSTGTQVQGTLLGEDRHVLPQN
jgi:hypothetical protein